MPSNREHNREYFTTGLVCNTRGNNEFTSRGHGLMAAANLSYKHVFWLISSVARIVEIRRGTEPDGETASD